LRIMELLTLNIFAQSLPFAVIGVALFAGLIALPWWPRRRPHDAVAANGQPAFGPRALRYTALRGRNGLPVSAAMHAGVVQPRPMKAGCPRSAS
jgi:hypothetical protein